jgi:alanine dehydrogenase
MKMESCIIGIPKEGEPFPGIFERRVALTPAGVRELIALGAKVIVEKEAGQGAGFSDLEYESLGAQIVYSHEEVFRRVNFLLKVSPLKLEEWQYCTPGITVCGFMHLAVVPDQLLQTIQSKKINVLGWEIIETAQGIKPLQRISSEIAGKMAPQVASRLLQAPPGLGILLGGIPGVPPADVVIVGAGVLGTYAALSFIGLGASVYVLDKDREKLERLYNLAPSGGKVVTAITTQETIEKFAGFADVLILSVQVSGAVSPIVLSKETLQKMRLGSVIIDFSIDQGGATEVTRRKGPQPEAYKEGNLIFFSLPNIPSLVPRTSSHALTCALLPYMQQVVSQGWPNVLEREPALRGGLYFYEGKCINGHLQGRCTIHSYQR